LGGVGGALAKSADGLLESLGPRKPKALQLLMALVQVGGSGKDRQDARQTIPKTQALRAAGGGVEAEEVLNELSGLRGQDTQKGELARPRLVVVSQGHDAGATTDLVDLAHETLLRYTKKGKAFWPTFRNEIDRHHRAIANRQLADQLAEEWSLKGRSKVRGLATWSQIRTFGRLPDLSAKALDFLRVSRWGKTIKTLLLLVPVLVVLGAVTWMQKENVTPQYSWAVLQARLGWVDIIEPKMVKITGGPFQQGSIQREREQPVRAVEIPDFQLGQFEVTFEEYDQYANLIDAVKLPKDQGWGRNKRPVIHVNWEDAKAYARWLSHATRKYYRLPTESEWEYAARSGKRKEKWAGTSDESDLNSFAVYEQSFNDGTAVVGSKQANEFRLYDMSGNVLEWVEDCWHGNYEDAPKDGRAWLEEEADDCGLRVVRGGSWYNGPVPLRASFRFRYPTGLRDDFLGFRLAQGTR
jgi:formylglycine-generating enzyme required for sulfatase activity